MKENEFQCSKCHGVFEKGWADEKAKAEAEQLWEPNQNMVLICDDCFQKFHPAKYLEIAVKHGYKLPTPQIKIKGWWWKKYLKKYRNTDRMMNDLLAWQWKNGGREEVNKAVLDSLINGRQTL
jgi:hypothetical protein